MLGAGGAVLIAIAVLYVAELEIVSEDGNAGGVEIPSLIGEETAQARAELEALGLEVRIDRPARGGLPPWLVNGSDIARVVSQVPEPGETAPPDAIATLVSR